jgi:hypothetical protein
LSVAGNRRVTPPSVVLSVNMAVSCRSSPKSAMDFTAAFTPLLHPCLSLVGARLAGLIDQALLCVLATQLHHFGMQLSVHTSQVNGKDDRTRNPDNQDDIDHKDKVESFMDPTFF